MSVLAQRVLSPTQDDKRKLERVIKYLKATKHYKLTLSPKNCDLETSIDASHGVYDVGKGHCGSVLTVGGAVIWARSGKAKLPTKSSTETELVAMSDKLSDVIWCRMFMESLGEPVTTPLIICQDNKSTIQMVLNGTASGGKAKHIQIRHFWMLDYIRDEELALKYVPTDEMLADVFTKPLHGDKFNNFVKALNIH